MPAGRLRSESELPFLGDLYRPLRDDLQALRYRVQEQKSLSQEEWLAITEHLEELVAGLEQQREQTVQWLKRLEHQQRALNAHVTALENSLIFRFLRWIGRPLLEGKAKAGQMLLHSPLHGIYLKLRPPAVDREYNQWIQQEAAFRPPAADFRRRPLFSVLMPVHNPRRTWLEEAIQSVIHQLYPCWELCICDDASSEPWVAGYLDGKANAEPRIRWTRSDEHVGISGALNRAASMATGDYVAFLDQDDVLSPFALHRVAEALQENDAALIYTDEDRLDPQGRRVEPIFKPGWSPDLLLSCMYFGHMFLVSRQVMERVGGFRPEFDGAQDYDLALRLTDRPAEIIHIPQVLYHWRKHPQSTAARPSAKPYTHAAGRKALEDALHRRSWEANVENGPSPNLYHLRWRLQGEPQITLIICSRSAKLLNRSLQAIRKRTDYPHWQIVVVQHVTGDDAAMEDVLKRHRVKRVRYEGAFHFSQMNNLGAEAADGDILIFLNDDVEPLVSSWLALLAAQAQRPEVGIVGAKLVYPSGSIQHAGIVIGISDGCGHPGRGTYGTPYWNWLHLTRDVSAVTGACLAVRREVFRQLGGFDDLFPVNYNDTDLCLRARRAGYRVVLEPAALLRHYECQTRRGGVEFSERDNWYARWSSELDQGDPFYSRNLTTIGEDVRLRLSS